MERKAGGEERQEDASYQYEDIGNLQNQMVSFESTKSEIVSSGLGQAIGLTASNTWSQIVAKIKAIVNRGTLNWSGNNTTKTVEAGYYPGGTLDSRPSYNNGYNAGVTAADNRSNPNSTNYKTGYNAGVAAADGRVNTGSASYTSGYNAGQAAKRDSVTISKVGPSDDDVTLNNYTFAATIGRCYVAAMGGDPGQFQNFSVSGASVLSNISAGDVPPNGSEFVRMITLKATSTSVTINWTGGSGSTAAYTIVGLIN